MKEFYFFIFVLVCFLFVFVDCKQTIKLTNSGIEKIDNKPIWPCNTSDNKVYRLQHLFIKEPDGKETSQQFLDVYSFTHVSHGILFYLLLLVINKLYKFNYQDMKYFYLFVLVETLWEVRENMTDVILKYRKTNLNSRDYAGDTIINSIGDILTASLGYTLIWYNTMFGVLFLLLSELFLYLFIHDNLIINIYQIFLS